MQQLFACNKGTNVLPLTMDKRPVSGLEGQNGLYASAVADKEKGEYIIKIANTGTDSQNVHLDIKGLKHNLTQGEVIILSSPEGIDKENSLTSPDIIKPEVESIEVRGKNFRYGHSGQNICSLHSQIKKRLCAAFLSGGLSRFCEFDYFEVGWFSFVDCQANEGSDGLPAKGACSSGIDMK